MKPRGESFPPNFSGCTVIQIISVGGVRKVDYVMISILESRVLTYGPDVVVHNRKWALESASSAWELAGEKGGSAFARLVSVRRPRVVQGDRCAERTQVGTENQRSAIDHNLVPNGVGEPR